MADAAGTTFLVAERSALEEKMDLCQLSVRGGQIRILMIGGPPHWPALLFLYIIQPITMSL